MHFIKKYPWQNPLSIANNISHTEETMALLYSAQKYSYSGNYSFLAWGIDEETNNLKHLKTHLSTQNNTHNFTKNFWVGYIGYETLSNQHPKNKYINVPSFYFFKPQNLIIFNHKSQKLEFFSNDPKSNINPLLSDSYDPPTITNNIIISNLSSNMSKAEYIEKVNSIHKSITNGEFYQANLTRKFFGNITKHNPFSIFKKLSNISPSPYSAYFKFDKNHILSSSPERFIKIDHQGKINARPIKGTINRINQENDTNIDILHKSQKDRAENLMIVDLMRNDLGISSKPSSVNVEQLFNIDSFSTLHHMSSTINAIKENNISTLDTILNAFPPGSMTGTPKIAVIDTLRKLENYNRGIYSGCLGYFAGDKSCDLSVVIRTLIIQQNKFEFQVGGAIIYDSDPYKEWQETLIKAKGICKALNLNMNQLAF